MAREGSLNGRPRKKRSLIKLKMAVFRPIPRARVSKARSVNPGALSNWRKAKRTSVIITTAVEIGYSEDVMWSQSRESVLQSPCQTRQPGTRHLFCAGYTSSGLRQETPLSRVWDFVVPRVK